MPQHDWSHLVVLQCLSVPFERSYLQASGSPYENIIAFGNRISTRFFFPYETPETYLWLCYPAGLNQQLVTTTISISNFTMSSDPHIFSVRTQTPNQRLRNQLSLERLLSFTLLSPVSDPQEVHEASILYHQILYDCMTAGAILRRMPDGTTAPVLQPPASTSNMSSFTSRVRDAGGADEAISDEDLVEITTEAEEEDEDDDEDDDGTVHLHRFFRCLYQYSPKEAGRANIVRMVLHGLFPPLSTSTNPVSDRSLKCILPRARCWLRYTPTQKEPIYQTLAAFAADFLDGFFVPLKAQGRSTPRVSSFISPTTRSEVGPLQGTASRLRNLRALCLLRDGNRCVITGQFDRGHIDRLLKTSTRAQRRMLQSGYHTEAAHIIPHALNALDSTTGSLAPSQHFVWRVMNMFDPGISAALEGSLIDTPANALILLPELHQRFGRLECYLEEVAANTYTAHHVRRCLPLNEFYNPRAAQLEFRNHEPAGIPQSALPCRRLLHFHRACCLILSMSGAAEYVERLLDDTEELICKGVLQADGSSDFTLMMRLRGLCGESGEQEAEESQRARVAMPVIC